MTLAQFWASTPRETRWHLQAYRRRRGWAVWHAEALRRAARLPSLELLCGTELPDRKPQSPEAMLGQIRAIHSLLAARRGDACPQ